MPGGGAPVGGPPENSGKALASLICGVLFFLWPLSAVAAVVLGHVALGEIKRSAGRLAGRGMAVGGLVAGYFGISMISLLFIAAVCIPKLLRARMAANEASAVGTLRAYNSALLTYANQCPLLGYPSSLSSLGPQTSGGDACAHADLVEPILAREMPVQRGYRFYYTPESHDQT